MTRRLLGLVGLVGLVLSGTWWAGGALGQRVQSVVYPVGAVEQGLARDPDAWLGRIILVHGVAVIYHGHRDRDTITTGLALRDAQLDAALTLAYGRPERLVAVLRDLPLVGRWLAPSQTLQPGRLVIYRVRLSRLAGGGCAPCYQAILLDSA
jgi:hypothetical protein